MESVRKGTHIVVFWETKWINATVTKIIKTDRNFVEITGKFDDGAFDFKLFKNKFMQEQDADPGKFQSKSVFWTLRNKRAAPDTQEEAGPSSRALMRTVKDLLMNDPAIHQELQAEAHAAVASTVGPVASRAVNVKGNKVPCFNFSKESGYSCVGYNPTDKTTPVGDIIPHSEVERLRRSNVMLSQLYSSQFAGTATLAERACCMKRINRYHPSGGIVVRTALQREQCIICRAIHSNGKRDWAGGQGICCGPVPMAEKAGIETFITNWLKPVKVIARANKLSIDDSYNPAGNASLDHTPDLPVKITCDANGKVVAVDAIELDTVQHSGYPPQQEKDRVQAIVRAYRAAYPDAKIRVVHFNMQGAFEAGGKKHTDTTMSHVARWLIARHWLVDFMLNYHRYPDACALYLFYSDKCERIMWPLKNGVCGNTYKAPKDDQSVGATPTKADWASAVDMGLMRSSFKGKPPNIAQVLLPDNCSVRSEVFGGAFGSKAKTPVGKM
eukprot:gene2297-8585_t